MDKGAENGEMLQILALVLFGYAASTSFSPFVKHLFFCGKRKNAQDEQKAASFVQYLLFLGKKTDLRGENCIKCRKCSDIS